MAGQVSHGQCNVIYGHDNLSVNDRRGRIYISMAEPLICSSRGSSPVTPDLAPDLVFTCRHITHCTQTQLYVTSLSNIISIPGIPSQSNNQLAQSRSTCAFACATFRLGIT